MEGLWPGVFALTADADVHCLRCARAIYGKEVIDAVVWGHKGYENYTDNEGNPFVVILNNSADSTRVGVCGDCNESIGKE